ncbi:hypothetical protein Pmani_040150 [Petrolisthes manimaculis]|nr:hypothetical protein Pmani_040150 [Petrolisthes manimaculis]
MRNVVIYKNVHYFIQRDKVLLQTHSALSANSTQLAENSSLTSNKQALKNSLVNSSGLRTTSSDSTAIPMVRVADGDEPHQNTLQVVRVAGSEDSDQNNPAAGESSGHISATLSGVSKERGHVMRKPVEENHHKVVEEAREKLTSKQEGRGPMEEDHHHNTKPTPTMKTLSEPTGNGITEEENLKGKGNVPGEAEKLNVIIFGTDSVSRLNMRRHLPKTFGFLQELGAVELTGYNKVADNTFPNLVPILSGLSKMELIKHPCMPKSRTFDACPWIFKDFKSRGYVTAFVEDAPWMGIFRYMQNGFLYPPTDYYGRPFFMASEKEIGGNKKGNANICQGAQLSMKVLHDYSLEVVRTFPDIPTLGLYWSCSLSHDYLNMVRLADLPHFSYLRELQELGALNHTAIIFLSDHGMRFGSIRSTYVGMLEERLPFVVIYLPPWFRVKYRRAFRNLAVNAHRLTSNYDLHQTLLDLAYGRFGDLAHVTAKPKSTTRGISLFQRVPRSRNCSDAGIGEHFCTCQDTREVTWDDPVLDLGATYLMLSINTDLDPFPACVQFTEARILTARVSMSNKQLSPRDKNSDVRSYLLQVDMRPGGVTVEATLRYNRPEQFQNTATPAAASNTVFYANFVTARTSSSPQTPTTTDTSETTDDNDSGGSSVDFDDGGGNGVCKN